MFFSWLVFGCFVFVIFFADAELPNLHSSKVSSAVGIFRNIARAVSVPSHATETPQTQWWKSCKIFPLNSLCFWLFRTFSMLPWRVEASPCRCVSCTKASALLLFSFWANNGARNRQQQNGGKEYFWMGFSKGDTLTSNLRWQAGKSTMNESMYFLFIRWGFSSHCYVCCYRRDFPGSLRFETSPHSLVEMTGFLGWTSGGSSSGKLVELETGICQ